MTRWTSEGLLYLEHGNMFLALQVFFFLNLRISAELQPRFLRFAYKYSSDPAVIWLAGMKLIITPTQPLTVWRWDDRQFYTIVYSCWRSFNCYWHNLSSRSQLRNRHGTSLGWTRTLAGWSWFLWYLAEHANIVFGTRWEGCFQEADLTCASSSTFKSSKKVNHPSHVHKYLT